ncbi:MAG: hypothetical protein GF331_12795 [Chitinivibrionales bacterium]|nr:hypothetical protein [Chitinivibrionales bacterium]
MKRTTAVVCLAVVITALVQHSVDAASPNGFVIWSQGGHENRELKYIEIREGVGPVESTRQTAVPKGAHGDIQCVISMDGSCVAFARQIAHSTQGLTDNPGDYHHFGNYDVYVARIDQGLPATPRKVGHGYWPSWGDDSDQPTKTLYYSWCSGSHGGELKVMKVTVGSNGSISQPVVQIQGFGTSGDAHMQPAPDGQKVAWRPGGVHVYDKSVNRDVDAGGGCHPSWGPNSYWLMWARGMVGAFDNGQRLWSGSSGLHDYHYGFSNDGNWVIGRIGSSGNDQNTDHAIIYYPCNASKRGEPVSWHVDRSQGETVGNGTWCDIHVNVGPSIGLSADASRIAMNERANFTLTMSGGASGSAVWSVDGGGTLSNQSNTGATFTSDGTLGEFTVTATVGDLQKSVTIRVIDPSAIDMKINCGGGAVGEWESDQPYADGGEPFDFNATISTAGVTDAPPNDVCKTVRHYDHTYNFPDLPNGSYSVVMYFTDAHGGRHMDYSIEGQQVLHDFDPITEAGGANTLCTKEFTVEVSDGNGLQIVGSKGSGIDVFEAALWITALGGSSNNPSPARARVASIGRTLTASKDAAGALRIDVALYEPYTLQILDVNGRCVCRYAASAPRAFTLVRRRELHACLLRLRTMTREHTAKLLLP